jgi:uncharacterized protein
MIRGRALIAAATLSLLVQVAAAAPVKIAIIIDDLGYELAAGRRAIELPGPVACAILPATPRGRQLAEIASQRGKEVLLHLPLEPVDYHGAMEPGAIMLDMSRATVERTFDQDIESVPHAIGVSSHRGSLLTRHPGHMVWLMHAIAAREQLFFIDSYTTADSIALQIAAESGVSATRRDVFLDNDRSAAALQHEFERLIGLARERGHAIAIGHPYPETLELLERELPELESRGVELVPVSGLVNDSPAIALQ